MTCVVAYIDKDGVGHIAADSAGTSVSQHYRNDNKAKKIFKKNDMMFGYTTSFRMGQILEHCLKLPDRNENITDYHYLISQLIPEIRKVFLSENYMLSTEKEGGNFLIVWNGNIYEVQSDFSVMDRSDSFASVGSGYKEAGSVMKTMLEYDIIEKIGPEEAVRKAIEITSRSNITVSGRIDYLCSLDK